MARNPGSVTLPANNAPIKVFRDSGSRDAQAMAIVSQSDADSDPLGDPTDAPWATGSGSIIAILKTMAGLLGLGATFTDASVDGASGESQQILAADDTRNYVDLFNPDSTSWWINPTGGTAAERGLGCFELAPGGRWTPKPVPRNAVTAFAAEGAKLTVITA